MRGLHILVTGATLLLHGAAMAATQFLGGNSLFHTWTTQSLEPGQMTVQWHTRLWAGSVPEGSVSDVSQALAINFGFGKHLELELVPMLYQDLNFSSQDNVTYNAPDDVYMRFRMGRFQGRLFQTPIEWGTQLGFRLNSSKVSNVYLEPYNASANEISLSFGLGWYQNQLYPGEGPSAHFNLGYLNHNDGGQDALNIFSGVTHDLEFSLAYRRPTLRWDFYTELYGNVFLSDLPEWAFTQADAVWLQPGFNYRFFRGLSASVGVDVRLMENGPKIYFTDEGPRPVGVHRNRERLNADYPEYYPAWRLAARLNFQPSTAFRRVETFATVRPQSERDWEMREKIGVTEREMIDWLGAEDQSAEFLDLELEKIRAERRQAEKELERLKDKLKDDKGN
ncbi:MAG: hypothetical protein WC326_11810 [Candidatus Delongbacteria bacterium]